MAILLPAAMTCLASISITCATIIETIGSSIPFISAIYAMILTDFGLTKGVYKMQPGSWKHYLAQEFSDLVYRSHFDACIYGPTRIIPRYLLGLSHEWRRHSYWSLEIRIVLLQKWLHML